MSGSSFETYRFIIQGTTVTAVYKMENGRVERESIESDESWTVQGNRILKTEYDDGRLETTVFVDSDGDGLYLELDDDNHESDLAQDDGLEDEAIVSTAAAGYGRDDAQHPESSANEETGSPHAEGLDDDIGTVDAHPQDNDCSNDDNIEDDVHPIADEEATEVVAGHDDGQYETMELADNDDDAAGSEMGSDSDVPVSASNAPVDSDMHLMDDAIDHGGDTIRQPEFSDDGTFESAGRKLYAFDIVDGQVADVHELENGYRQAEDVAPHERYEIEGSDILKIESHTNGQEITRYRDADGDGLYAKYSKQYVADGLSDSGEPAPQLVDALNCRGSDGEDYVALTADGPALGGSGADMFVFRELGHLKIGDFDFGSGDRIVFDTGLGFTSLEQVASCVTGVSYDGQDIHVEFGENVSLTLVGVMPVDVPASSFIVLS